MTGAVGSFVGPAEPGSISYSLPLPGSHMGRRIMQIDLDLDSKADFLPSAFEHGETFADQAGISRSARGGAQVDPVKAETFLRQRLLAIGFDRDRVDRSLALLPKVLAGEPVAVLRRAPEGRAGQELLADREEEWVIADPVLGDPAGLVHEFAVNALGGVVAVPGVDGAGKGDVTPVPEHEEPDPRLFLIERYAISSFLGSYGLGRTVRTFTLLPGETTTIRLRTWQSTAESVKHSSSIIDSHEQSAKDRFSSKVQDETTDKMTRSKTETWAVEAQAKASWGWGSAKVKASASGEYQSGREQFARQLSESVSDHAKESSSKRELSVTSSTEITSETGAESVIEREISNVNMRRVLNFVFRELNQEYTTKLHLTDIQVGFTNGLAGTWRQVPMSGLRGLLSEVLEPGKIDEVAALVLQLAGVVFDVDDEPVRVLEVVDYNPADDTFTVTEMKPGVIDPPTERRSYRFRRGSLHQDGHRNPVGGVLLSEQTIVMKTDSVIAEALLGEADGLDNYAMEIQEAAARERTLKNEREDLIHQILNEITDPETRATFAARLFNPAGVEP